MKPPGRSGGFILPSPLRTVRDSFPSYVSSTIKAHLCLSEPGYKYVTLAMLLYSQLAYCVEVHTMNFHPRSFAFLNSLVLKSFSPLSTRQRSAWLSPAVMLQPLSTPLQGSLRLVCPLCPTFPYASRLRFFPCYLHEMVRGKAPGFHSLSRFFIGIPY